MTEKDQTQVFREPGDAGTEDQAVQSLRAEAEKLVNGLLPPFGKRQICFNISTLPVYIDGFMAFCFKMEMVLLRFR